MVFFLSLSLSLTTCYSSAAT